MISNVEILLARWGRWASTGRSSGLGYPRSAAFTRDMPLSDGYGSRVPDLDTTVLAVDDVVNAMPVLLRRVCIETYQYGGSKRAIAARMHVGKSKFYTLLDEAHAFVCSEMSGGFYQ